MGTEHLDADGVTLLPVGNGVSRVSWTAEVQARGFERAAAAVRARVDLALADLKQARVEALVDPEDALAARIATWAGLHREGVMRRAVVSGGARVDRVLFARVEGDAPLHDSTGFRAVLNSFLPRKRAISQLLVRDTRGRVLLCRLTYKQDWDLPGGVVEVGESPQDAVRREVLEELGLSLPSHGLVLTDWLPPWGGWDDAICLVYDGGVHEPDLLDGAVVQAREIRTARFCTDAEIQQRCADFTARRIRAAVRRLGGGGAAYTESGRH